MGSENAAAPTRVVGYTRVSRREQAVRGISLEAQRAALETECRRRGWELVALHEDAGRSGKRLNGRPGVNAALADVRAGRADVLLVVRVDRLSRSTLDLCQLAEEMRTRRRVRRGSYLPPWSLVSLAEGDTDVMSAAGGLSYDMRAAVAQYERKVIGERTRAALALLKAKGVRLGRRPAKASTRRRIVALRDSGLSWRAVADWLNAHGVKTPQGGSRWFGSTARAVYMRATRGTP